MTAIAAPRLVPPAHPPEDERDEDGAPDHERAAVVAGHARDPVCAVARGAGRGLARAVEHLVLLVVDARLGLLDLGLGLGLDVRLLGDGRDRVAHLAAGPLDVGLDLLRGALAAVYRFADLALVFAHSTSSFVLEMARSGTGGPPACVFLRPTSASTPAPIR